MEMRFPRIMLGACMLPWKADYSLDEPVFRRHIRSTINQGFQHIYLMGTAGEGYAMTDCQFHQVVSVFREEMQGPALHPMVGVISLSMGHVIERIRFAYDLGIRHFQISLPAWHPVNDQEMMNFFRSVCGSFPEAKFLHYNLIRTQRLLTGSDYRKIADAIPNLVATKNSTSDYARVADLMTHVPDLQHCLLENAFAFGCLFGECSLLPSLGVLFPNLFRRFFDVGADREVSELMEMHRKINQISNRLYGRLRSTPRVDGAYDKLIVWLSNPSFPLRLLPPYQGISDEDARETRQVYEREFMNLE